MINTSYQLSRLLRITNFSFIPRLAFANAAVQKQFFTHSHSANINKNFTINFSQAQTMLPYFKYYSANKHHIVRFSLHSTMKGRVSLANGSKDFPQLSSVLTQLNLANAYKASEENIVKKKELLEQALPAAEKYYGKDHIAVAIILFYLGTAYGVLGNGTQKKQLLERALVINERHYGKDHVEVAVTLNSLATAYGILGNTSKGIELLERALSILERQYGKEHPQLAMTLFSLGNSYKDAGEPLKGKELLERMLSIQERYFGKDNPQTALTLYFLAKTELDLGNFVNALELAQRCLEIFENNSETNILFVNQARTLVQICRQELRSSPILTQGEIVTARDPKSPRNSQLEAQDRDNGFRPK